MRSIRGFAPHLIHTYDQLPTTTAKEKARQEILALEKLGVQERITRLRYKNLNQRINDAWHIRGLVNRLALYRKLESDPLRCEKFIESNQCHFTENGEYLTYT